MKKIMMGLLASLGMIMAMLAVMPTASAGSVDYSTPWKCHVYADFSTCMQLDWSKQADGTGVRLEGIGMYTGTGCGNLEDSGGKYNPVQAYWLDPDTGYMNYDYEFGAEGCSFYKDVSNAGTDTGGMELNVGLKARRDLAADRWMYFAWTVRTNGTWDVYMTDAPV